MIQFSSLSQKDNDMIIDQIYFYDTMFGTTNALLCEKSSKSMNKEFEMSIMGEFN